MTIIHLNGLGPRDAQGTLFNRLFDHMMEAEPQVPVRPEVIAAIVALRNDILNGEPLYAEIGLWGIIFDGIRWDSASSGFRVGVSLLQFAGYLGEALKEHGPSKFPPARALMLMFAVIEVPLLKVVDADEPDASFEVTAEGIEELGVSGHVSLFEAVPLFDTPQELLEELLDLQARARRSEG